MKAQVLSVVMALGVLAFGCEKKESTSQPSTGMNSRQESIELSVPPLTGDYNDPQYLMILKAPMGQNTCCHWDQYDPTTFNQASINEFVNEVGSRGNTDRRLGISFKFSVFGPRRGVPRATLEQNTRQSLQNLLNLTQANNLPVLVRLDSTVYWEGRPDLWNWFRPSYEGYSPYNVFNVEWFGPDILQHGTMASWYNWGHSLAKAPAPNLRSPIYRDAVMEQYQAMAQIIKTWFDALPASKKYLFAGVVATAEAEIGVNGFFCPNGNSYVGVNEPPGCDTDGNGVITYRDGIQVGYAARSAGGGIQAPLSPTVLGKIVNEYVTFATKILYDAGIPRHKIYSHAFDDGDGNVRPDLKIAKGDVALNPYSSPGWSFYGPYAGQPATKYDFSNWMNSITKTYWGALEWNDSRYTQADWTQGLRTVFATSNNKVIDIIHWELIHGQSQIMAAFRTVLSERPTGWITTPQITSLQVSGRKFTVGWKSDKDSVASYLVVSTNSSMGVSGLLKYVNVINANVTGMNSYTSNNLNPGTYYLQIVTDTGSRRTISERTSFVIP